jgi:L-lactate dehydrogenase complex protein LldE
MGQDRIQEHLVNKIDYLVGADTSCLMHMEGILRRQQSHVQIKHVIEILNHHA